MSDRGQAAQVTEPLVGTAISAQPLPDVAPITCDGFLARLKGTPDEVWSRLIRVRHGLEFHDHATWLTLIDRYRNNPVHPSVGV